MENLGSSYPLDPSLKAFPTPLEVASVDLDFFQKNIRLGYRNEYILQLARNIVDRKINLNQYLDNIPICNDFATF